MAKKRLNKSVVVGLTLFTFVLMIVLSIIMLSQLRKRDPAYFVVLAEQAAAGDHWDQAAIFYKEAWRRSGDAAHLAKIGEALLECGDVPNALLAWQQALVSDPNLLSAHRARLEVLLESAKLNYQVAQWQQVLNAAEDMQDAAGEGHDVELAFALHAKGLAMLHLTSQDPEYADRGIEVLEKAVALDTECVTYAIDLIDHYVQQDHHEQAKQRLDELVSRHTGPGDAASRARTAYAIYQADLKESEAARAYFNDAIALAEGAPEAQLEAELAYGAFLTRQWGNARREGLDDSTVEARLSEAENVLRRAIEQHPDSYDPYLQLATLLKLAGRNDRAVEVCEQRLLRGLSRRGVRASRNRHNTFILMILAAENCVAEAIKAQQNDRLDDSDSWLKRADQYVTDARGEVPDHPRVFAQIGQIKVARGEYRAALENLRAADESYRSFSITDWSNKMLLARVHMRLGEGGAARRVLEGVLPEARRERANDPAFWLLFAQTLVETGDLERARMITEGVLRGLPDLEEAKQVMAAILERLGRPDAAGALIADQTLRTILEAKKKAMEGDVEGAIARLQDALEQDPGNVSLVSAILPELMGRERTDEAKRIVDRALQKNPDDSKLKRMAVSVAPGLTKEERDAELLKVIESEPDAFRKNLDLSAFYLQRDELANSLVAIDEAERHLIVKDTPLAQRAQVGQHRALLRLKMRVAGQLDDQAAMIAARDAAVKYDVDAASGKSLLGLYHMLRAEFDLAIRAFREAVTRQPTDAWALTLLGDCLLEVGRLEEARAVFDDAARVNPKDGLAQKGLALVARERGDDAAFDQHFAECERLIPTDPWVRAMAVARIEQADPFGAIERREARYADNPKDLDNLKRLAQLSEQVNDRDRSDRYYEQLLLLVPDDAQVVSVSAAYYRRTGRPDRSLDLLRRFAARRPAGPERAQALLQVAAHYIEQYDIAQAERVMLEAVGEAESLDVVLALADFYMQKNVDPAKAMPWLDKAVALGEAESSARLSRILQARIQCKLSRPVDDTAGAQRDVDLLRSRFPNDPTAMLWQGEVHVQTGRNVEAIRAFTDYLTQRPTHTEALHRRALTQIVQGNISAAIDDLETIKRFDPLAMELRPRLLLSNLYLRMNQPQRCLRELQELVTDAPESETALQALVETYIRLGRAAAADEIVTAQINRGGDEPDARWLRLRGKLSWSLREYDKAIADYRRAIQRQGVTTGDLVAILDIFHESRRYGEGIAYHDANASGIQPDARVLGRYAALLVLNGNEEDGVQAFRRAMTLCPKNDIDALRDIARCLYMAYPTADALEHALTSFKADIGQGDAGRIDALLRVRLYHLARRWESAIEEIDNLLPNTTLEADRAQLLHEKGELLHRLGRGRDARRTYEEALKYNANNWMTLNNLAYLLSDEFGEYEAALPFAQQAAALTDNADVLDTLGWIYAGLGDYSSAITELSRALRLDPESALTQYHLGEVYRRNGQFTEAQNALSGALDLAHRKDDDALVKRIEAAVERVNQRDRTQ